jgi:hypothetical protein
VLPGVEFSAGRDGGEAVFFGLCSYSVKNEISFGAGTQQTFSARGRCAIIRPILESDIFFGWSKLLRD